MKNVLGCLSIAALAVILAAPISAESTAVRANVPFDFMVGGRTLPAGGYEFGLISQGGVLRVMSESGATSAMVPRIERELATRASLNRPQTVMVLARL